MTVHDPDCDCDTYGCQLRRKGTQVSPAATPNRRNTIPPRKIEASAYNKQVMGEHRAGGTFAPYLDSSLRPIRQKAFAERRHELTEIRRAQLNATDPAHLGG